MVDRPATASTLVTVSSGQSFLTSLIPTAVGNATKVFDVDSALTDTAISGAYIDEIFFRYTKKVIQTIDAVTAPTGTYSANSTTCTVTLSTGQNLQPGQKGFLDLTSLALSKASLRFSLSDIFSPLPSSFFLFLFLKYSRSWGGIFPLAIRNLQSRYRYRSYKTIR